MIRIALLDYFMLHLDVWLGPNAVLAYKREGYSYFSISPSDIYDALSFRYNR